MEFRIEDAESLSFSDEGYDYVTSCFGAMFIPNQDQVAVELFRVCKKGGKIGLANWTSGSFIGQLFKTIGSHFAPPAGLKSSVLWGTRERLEEFFGIQLTEQSYVWRYKFAKHWLKIGKRFMDLFKSTC